MAFLWELSDATGWRPEELVEIIKSPDLRPERCRRLYEGVVRDALELYERGHYRAAGWRLYGAALALAMYCAARAGAAVSLSDRGSVEGFIARLADGELRRALRDALDSARPLLDNYHEWYLDEETFKERWEAALTRVRRLESLVFGYGG